MLGDFNDHVRRSVRGYAGVHRGFGRRERNRDGERILEFADSVGMMIGNTLFKKDNEKLIH